MPFQHWDFKPSQLHSRDKDPVPELPPAVQRMAPCAFHLSLWPGKLLHLSSPILTFSAPHPASYSNSFFLAGNIAPSPRAEIWIFLKGKSQSIPHLWPSCHFPWWPLLSRGLCFTKLHLRPSPLQGPQPSKSKPLSSSFMQENWTEWKLNRSSGGSVRRIWELTDQASTFQYWSGGH